ncbi:hypothetical protein [Lelliottia wanjuensis]|uniref:hypothetical protein n=2 Tax=Lelliottia wanjuensis TaxID=3050585 RepID=UPI0032B80719
MDAVTVLKMGVKVTIDGVQYDAVETRFIPDMGPVVGDGLDLVVFDKSYSPKRGDVVAYDGQDLKVTRYEMFNKKPRIWLE